MISLTDLDYWKGKFEADTPIKIGKRHFKSDILKVVLMFCYQDVYGKYGKLIPTKEKEESIYTDENGIMFTEDIDINYLNEIESLFLDGSYEYKFYDYLRYCNIGDIDIKQIKNKYSQLDLSSIRDITLYAKNEYFRNEFFKFLNEKNSDFQTKFCKLIRPISIEVTTKSKFYGYFGSEFVELIKNLINGDSNDNEQLKKTYESINECEKFSLDSINYGRRNAGQKEIAYLDNPNIKTNNVLYICEFEYFFQDLIIKCLQHLDNENLDTLLRIKDYSLNNIPPATGKSWRKNIYIEQDRSYCYNGHLVHATETVFDRYEEGDNINFNIKKIYDEQKAIINIFRMYLDNNFDYKELLYLNCSDICIELIEVINNKDKVLVMEKKSK